MSGFGQTDPVRKQAGGRGSSGPLLANASDPIRMGLESDRACFTGVMQSESEYFIVPVQVYREIFLAVHNNKQDKQQTNIFK